MALTKAQIDFVRRYASITGNKTYRRLKNVPRHGSTDTFEHSVRVAELAFRLAPYWGVHPDSAARVGLLHDFCLVNYHEDDREVHGGRWYCFYHPEDAVENSLKEGFYLSRREQKAILSHMFPLSRHIPTSRLAALLTYSDKAVAIQESMLNISSTCQKFTVSTRAYGKLAVQFVRNNTYGRFREEGRS